MLATDQLEIPLLTKILPCGGQTTRHGIASGQGRRRHGAVFDLDPSCARDNLF